MAASLSFFFVVGLIMCLSCFIFQRQKACDVVHSVERNLYEFYESETRILNPVDVILIYSSDNDFHRNVVKRLATFLNHQCKCNVKIDAWQTEDVHRFSSLEWLLRQIKTVDNVIVVHSEGSYRQYDAHMKNLLLEKVEHDTPLEDMFIPAVKEFQNEFYLRQQRKKFFHVFFPYTEKCHVIDLKLGKTYLLMNHIEELFLSLHNLSKFSCLGTLDALLIKHDGYAQSAEGQRLQTAIREAQEYFSKNKSWFDATYKLKLELDQGRSKGSHVFTNRLKLEELDHLYITINPETKSGEYEKLKRSDSGIDSNGSQSNSTMASPDQNCRFDPQTIFQERSLLFHPPDESNSSSNDCESFPSLCQDFDFCENSSEYRNIKMSFHAPVSPDSISIDSLTLNQKLQFMNAESDQS